MQLAHRTVYSIPDAAGMQVRCTAGSLWLTLDHDPRDIVLAAGEWFATSEHRRALLYALEPADFTLVPVPQPACAVGLRCTAQAV
jgi:hypothetical protein